MNKPIFVSSRLIEETIGQLRKINENLGRIADEIEALQGRVRGRNE